MATADSDSHLQTEWDPSALDLCVICRTAPVPARTAGRFQTCPDCKKLLAQRSALRQAAMHPERCMGCHKPLRADGGVYCPRCHRRFNGLPHDPDHRS
jgi:hypothetical protein